MKIIFPSCSAALKTTSLERFFSGIKHSLDLDVD